MDTLKDNQIILEALKLYLINVVREDNCTVEDICYITDLIKRYETIVKYLKEKKEQ